MKYKNLNIRKVFFSLGLAFVLTSCGNKEITIKEPIVSIDQLEENNNDEENKTIIEIDNTDIEVKNEKLEVTVVEQIDYKENSYTKTNLNLRDKDDVDGNIITVIDKCQKIVEIESLGLWSYVKYNDNFGYVNNSYIETLPEDYIEVDISEQNIKYHIGEELLIDSDIVTGRNGVNDTRIGMFEIYSRETSRYLTGTGYRSYVDYWMPFDGGIGLHDAQWRSEFGGDIYMNSGSHGCVNLPLEVAETIYENSKVGTKVLVHK